MKKAILQPDQENFLTTFLLLTPTRRLQGLPTTELSLLISAKSFWPDMVVRYGARVVAGARNTANCS